MLSWLEIPTLEVAAECSIALEIHESSPRAGSF